MRSDEEIAKAVEEILRAKSDRSLQDAGAGGAEGLAGAGRAGRLSRQGRWLRQWARRRRRPA